MATTLNGLENQTKVITMNALGEYDNLRPQVKPVEATHAQMVAMRDQGKLIPGQLYRITDYVTTVNELTAGNARSAGHPFDIIVMALDATTLSEEAWAIQHDGDEYFANSNLAAWKLRYTLDNIQWSKVAGTYVFDEENDYTFMVLGDITLQGQTYKLLQGFGMYIEDWSDYALMETVAEGETIYCYYGDPEEFDPDAPEEVGTASSVSIVSDDGKGTITYLKDEFHNECPYDFKNIQTKRWKVTDLMEGRTGFTDTYLGVLGDTADKLSIEDEDDFIWCFTFSSDAAGGVQTDFSLDATHLIFGNVIKKMNDGSLPNNVFFNLYCYQNTLSENCYNNSFSLGCQYNSFSQDCRHNSFSENCQYNSFSQGCRYNSFSENCQYNSFSQGCYDNSFSQGCKYNRFSQNCTYNRFSQDCQYNRFSINCYNNSFSQNCSNNSFSQSCSYNSFSQNCSNNSFSENVSNITLSSNYLQKVIVESGNQKLKVLCNQPTSVTQPCVNIKIEQGVGNTTSEKTVTITTRNQNYQTVVKNANSVEITA